MSDFDMSDDDLDFDDLDMELETTVTVKDTDEPTVKDTDEPTVKDTDEPTVKDEDEPTIKDTDEAPVDKTKSKNALNDLSEEDFDNIDIDDMLLDVVESESVEDKKKPIKSEKKTNQQKIKQKLPKEVKKLLASIKTADLIDDREDINNAQVQRKQLADRLANDPVFDKMYKKAEKRYFKSVQDSDESVSSSAPDSIDSSGSEYLEAEKLVWQHHNKSKYTTDIDEDTTDSSTDSYDSIGYVGKNGRKNTRGRERQRRKHKHHKDPLRTPDLSRYGTVTDIIPDDVSDDDSYEEPLKYDAPQKVGIYAPGAVFNINFSW